MFMAMPAPMRIRAGVGGDGPWPLTVREGRHWLEGLFPQPPAITSLEPPVEEAVKPEKIWKRKKEGGEAPVIELKEVWFKYQRELPDVVKDLSLKIFPGEMYCIVGGNGTGKTTTLSIIAGLRKPYRGKVFLKGRPLSEYGDRERYQEFLGVLPQNPQSLFVRKTVELDLYEMLEERRLSLEEKDARVDEVIALTHLEDLLNQHPYDLSGGEQQRLGLAKILLMRPKILLLDEPTKGLDKHYKFELGQLLKDLQKKSGVTIVMVSHDVEFCARFGDRCGLFFDGGIVTDGKPRAFFSGNSFYTTSANRMSRQIFKDAVTAEDVITLCKKNQNP